MLFLMFFPRNSSCDFTDAVITEQELVVSDASCVSSMSVEMEIVTSLDMPEVD